MDAEIIKDQPNRFSNRPPFADGGGVRGLSSLLILQDLMAKINSSVKAGRPPGETHKEVQPYDIFDLVAGTSTGGLIAIMLGKLGMTLGECIEAYHILARTIFSKKHIWGKLTGGLAPSKFSGSNLRNCIGNIVALKCGDRDLPMASDGSPDKIAWYREPYLCNLTLILTIL